MSLENKESIAHVCVGVCVCVVEYLPQVFLEHGMDNDPNKHVEEYVEQVPDPVQVHGLGQRLGVQSRGLAICKDNRVNKSYMYQEGDH